jgi:aryl-alcohol dehydrogenase-like predicted oxidoreductase
VSRLILGTANFGPETSEEDSQAIMDRAHEHGINFFDTANFYGVKMDGSGESGVTEQIIGRWFATGGGRREKTVLGTKLYHPMGTWPNEGQLSALHIRRACDASLKRLQTDYIDLYQMHRTRDRVAKQPANREAGQSGDDVDQSPPRSRVHSLSTAPSNGNTRGVARAAMAVTPDPQHSSRTCINPCIG